MMFDPTISLGMLINAGVLLVGFVIAFTKLGGRIDLLSERMKSTEEVTSVRLKCIEDVLKDSKDFDKRLTTSESVLATAQRDIYDLRRGDGFITASHRKSIDGEYP